MKASDQGETMVEIEVEVGIRVDTGIKEAQ